MFDATKKDQSFKGFETFAAQLQMNAKMHLYIVIGFLIAQSIATSVISFIVFPKAWTALLRYGFGSLLSFDFPDITMLFKMSWKLAIKGFWIFILTSSVWFFYPKVLKKMKERAKKQSEDKYIRGSKMITADELNEQIRKDKEETHINIGQIKMPVSAETKHIFIIGRPGVGKTVAIRQAVSDIRDRDDKAVIFDFKGDYLCKFFDPARDVIFNPLDTRCIGWNLFNEIETVMDIDSISVSLIPPAVSNSDPFWNDAARDVFAGILHYLYQQNMKSNADIWNAVTAAGEDINAWLKDTRGGERGYRYIEDASSKQAMSVFAVMMQYVKSFEYLSKTDGDFSLTKWLTNDKGGFIFITSYSDIEATLKPILSLVVDLLGRKILSLPDDRNRRIFLMLDEMGRLQRLSTIIQLLTLSRSKGGSCWQGIQDIGQLDKIYTPQLRQSIVNACASNLILNVADPDAARFLSEKIGDTEYVETEETHSMGVEDNRDGISLVRRKRTEKLILPSEIKNLRELHGFLKLSNYDWAKMQLQYRDFPDVAPSFICRGDLNLEKAIKDQAENAKKADRVLSHEGTEVLKNAIKRERNRDKSEDADRDIEVEFDFS